MEYPMADKSVQQVVDTFVNDLRDALKVERDQQLLEFFQKSGMDVGFGDKPVARKKTTSRSISKPCPVDGCDKMAAPRHQMVCKEHSTTLSREEILMARDKAEKPGGIWYELKQGKKRKSKKRKGA
jgi:hypothetical protein